MTEGLQELYDASYRRIVQSVVALTRDLPEAEDVVQEAFVRAVGRWDRISRYDEPELWVRTVALNLARSRWRRARRGAQLMLKITPTLTDAQPPSADRVAIVTALKTLPPAQREAIALHHLGDLSVEDVARHQGVPAGTVKARLSRGRTALAKALGDNDFENEGVAS